MILGVIYGSLYTLIGILVASILAESFIDKNYWVSKRLAYFSLEAGPTLGLLGTLFAFFSNKEILEKALADNKVENVIQIFLGAWGTSILGIIVALISLIFLHFFVIEEGENNAEDQV